MDTGDLTRDGRRVALQQQPFAVLRILLSRPGEVVTRDELRSALWPSDTFVDFEAGLNAAVKRVRRALDDVADNPRYINTLPRRGYSFIAPVSRGEDVTSEVGPTARGRLAIVWPVVAVLAGLAVLGYIFRPAVIVPSVEGVVALTPPLAIPSNQTLVTDGPSVFFARIEAGGQRELMKVSSSGGTPVPLELPEEFHGATRILDISSDESELLVRLLKEGHSSLWAIPAEGGPPKRLGNLEAVEAAWLPDGAGVIFGRGNNLYTADLSGQNVGLVTQTPGEPMDPRWSPDRRRLRYTVYDHGRNTAKVWNYDALSQQAQPLRPEETINSAGEWTDDGRFYVFGSAITPGTLWARRESAPFWRRAPATPVQLTSGPISFASPIPSHDRKHLYAIGTMGQGELVQATKSGWKPYLDGRSADALTYSRDGRWLAYVVYPECSLWRMDRKTGARLQLVHDPGSSLMPMWSPDGREIEYTQENNGRWRLMEVASDGGQKIALTPTDLDAGQASWSPSGKQLALVYRHLPKNEPQRLGVMDLATRHIADIPGSADWGYPQWSPDGQNLLARKPGSHGLTVYNFHEQRWREIPAPSNVNYPTWSPDGRSIVFNTLGSDRPGVYRIRVLDAAVTRFGPAQIETDLHGFVPAGSYGDWSGLDPEGGFLLLRNVGWSAIYRLNWQP